MSEEQSFRDLIRRVRAGDAAAASDLVRRYEPTIRRIIRAHLTDANLRRVLDSVDICQSVLASFFVRAASGQYDLERPSQLLQLLATMARNKFLTEAAKQRAARRDYRRMGGQAPDPEAFVDRNPRPSQVVATQEILHQFRNRLSEQERRLADLRAAGCAWGEIAKELGGNPEALRMQWVRAIDRVAQEMQLEN
jgi:RNA polymerase sigma factor (sigma-70 family)